ncbi:general substrate transporter [Mycena leptocephala]|nr:general substrate transporter [Mycena leptocephala]
MHPSPSKSAHVVSELVAIDTRPWYRKPKFTFDTNLMDVLRATNSWKRCNFAVYHSPGPSLLGLMTAIYSLGAICSLPLVPLVVDRRGRRESIILGCTLMVVGAVLQGTAQNAHMFIAARFILGFGVPFSIVGSASLIAELSYPKERAVMTSLFNGFFGIGSIIIASVSLRTCNMHSNWGWRIPSLLQATPSIIQLIFVMLVPESPRWLVAKGRGAEAEAILVKYHAEGDAQSEFAKVEYADIEKTLREEIRTASQGWFELFSTPAMRKRAIIAVFLGLAIQWSYLPRILAGIGIHDNLTKNRLNLALSSWGLLCAIILALIAPRFKRRTMFLICTVSILVVLIGWTAATAEFTKTGDHAWATTVLVFIFMFSPAYSTGYSVLVYTYLMELFPFRIRAKGIVLFSWFGRISLLFNQLVNPIGLENAGWKYYIRCARNKNFILADVVFVYLMFPETAHLTLEELAFLYEDNKTQAKQETKQEKATSLSEELARVEPV